MEFVLEFHLLFSFGSSAPLIKDNSAVMASQTAEDISASSSSQNEATPSSKDSLKNSQWDLEDIILKVARAISDDDQIERLGRALGFQYPDIKRFIETNRMQGEVTTHGTRMMLRKWAEKVSVTEEQQALRDALRKADLVQIEENCLPNEGHPSIPSGSLQQDKPMSPEMKKFQKELKDTYCREYSMIKTSPLDPESEKRLQDIYVKLELIIGDEKKGEKKKPLEYDEMFDLIRTETESGLKTRFAFIGEAGVGKSTLLARIAFDWATGKCLQEIALLFLLPLREVMKEKHFGDIALNYVSVDIELEGKEIDGFIRNNQKQVLFLFDGLDESKMLLQSPDRDDAGVSILRGEKFRESAVIVTTRPSHVEQIKTSEKIRKQYTFVLVEGFTKENTAEYVRRFFEDDTHSSSSLTEFINTNELIAEHMAPYPIFCSMLCHLWKSESKRDAMQKLSTYSQIMKEMVFSLQEQYCSKYSGDDYAEHMKRTNEAMAKIGSVAFEGLLINQLVFKKDEIPSSVIGDANILCELGILTKSRKLLPREVRLKVREQFVDEFRFPHKLMQEFMAGHYLASLYDTDLSEFQRVLREKLLRSRKDFRYVLYFTAAHGGAVGRSVMEALCHVHQKGNYLNFIMEVAFECQDMEAIDHVANLVRRERRLKLNLGYSGMSHHAVSGYLLTLERCGQRAIRTGSIPRNLANPSNVSATSSSSYMVAVGLFTLENLRMLDLGAGLDDDFYTGMATYGSKSQIEDWTHHDVSLRPFASRQYARGIFSMPALTSLWLLNVDLDTEFFSTMVDVASQSKIGTWSHTGAILGPSASQQYARGLFSMPKLSLLHLDGVELDNEFFSTVVQVSPQSKIGTWSHTGAILGPSASQQYATGLVSMPELSLLQLDGVELDDEFFSTMVQVSPQSKILSWSHTGASLGPSASQQYAIGLVSMPELTLLNLEKVTLYDEFFSSMVQGSPQSKTENCSCTRASLSPFASQQYARGLFSMPDLTSLKLDEVKLDDQFFSTMVQLSPQSKIQELELDGLAMTRHALRTFLSLPCLQSLKMGRDITCTESDEGDTSVESSHGNRIGELSVYSGSVVDLWKLGLQTSCLRVTSLTIVSPIRDVLSSDTVSMACSPFRHLMELDIWYGSVDPVSFCNAMMSSCPRLNTLSFTVVPLSNEKATEIIQCMGTHPQLQRTEFHQCGTTEDPLIAEVNEEGKLAVITAHDRR